VPFWQRLAAPVEGPILELGCGTGRVTFPLARDGAEMIGVDRSEAMLARAATRKRRTRRPIDVKLVRGDIRHLPFPDRTFPLVMAPYGILQSLLRERDLADTLAAVARALKRDGVFGLELVADLPSWEEYKKRVSLRGRRAGGSHVSLIESVRQDRARRLTIFEQEFVEKARGTERRRTFTLTFRTLTVAQMVRRLEKAGFEVSALLGDYQGGPWDPRAEVWIILARKAE
jgi:ubiquinone/menaquinone biosynthesis C-methylase UbiE